MYNTIIITGDPLGSLPVQSEDYKKISSNLNSQICVKASISSEEKVCCRNDDDGGVSWKGDWTKGAGKFL